MPENVRRPHHAMRVKETVTMTHIVLKDSFVSLDPKEAWIEFLVAKDWVLQVNIFSS